MSKSVIDSNDGFNNCKYCNGEPIVLQRESGCYAIKCSVCELTTKDFVSKENLMHFWNGR